MIGLLVMTLQRSSRDFETEHGTLQGSVSGKGIGGGTKSAGRQAIDGVHSGEKVHDLRAVPNIIEDGIVPRAGSRRT